MNFRTNEKLIIWISMSKKEFFSKQEVDRKMIFPWYLRSLLILRNEEGDASAPSKKEKMR